MTCDRCYQDVSIGEHGVGLCPLEPRKANAVIPDDVPGGFVVENGFDRPTRFDSRSEHQRALADRGLQTRFDNRGPNDKIAPRWDTVDLEGAAALLTRGSTAIRERNDRLANPWPKADMPITVTDGGVIRRKDMA